MILIKILTILIAFISVSKTYLDYRKKHESKAMFIFWTIVWSVVTVIITFPILIDRVVAYTRDRSITISSLIGMSFVFMLYIIYRIYTKAARIEYRQNELIRKLGLAREFGKKGVPKTTNRLK